MYAQGQLWLTKKDVVGRARGFLPYVGMVTIYMNEYPKFKVYNKQDIFKAYYKIMYQDKTNTAFRFYLKSNLELVGPG